MGVLRGKDAQIRVSGSAVPFTDEATSVRYNTEYTIVDASKRLWDRSAGLTITMTPDVGDPVVVTESPELGDTYRVDWQDGRVIFDSAADRGVVTVSGSYLNTTIAAYVKGFTIKTDMEMEDTTVLNDLDSKEEPVGHSTSGTIDTLYVNNTYFIDKLLAKEPVLLEWSSGPIESSLLISLESAELVFNAKQLTQNNISFREARL